MAKEAKNNPVGWFEIYVNDLERAQAFYEKVFDVELETLQAPPGLEMRAFPGNPNTYGCPGALAKMPGVPVGNNSVIVYFSCEDCANEQKKAAQSGGKVLKEKFAIGEYGFIALVNDTEGNVIGLHSMK